MARAFSLDSECWRRGLGNGICLCDTDVIDSAWEQVISWSKLKAGTRLLWHEDLDQRLIDLLRE